MLDAIALAVKETAARAAAGTLDVVAGMLGPVLRLSPSDEPEGPRPQSVKEILDAIDKALAETRRRLAEAEAQIDRASGTEGGV
jgi:hypothetical protein